MRLFALAFAFGALALGGVRAQGLADPDEITPLVTPTTDDLIVPLVTAVTSTYCLASDAPRVTPGVGSIDLDPYHPPKGYRCYEQYAKGGGTWTIPIGGDFTDDDDKKNDKVFKVIVPAVVASVGALALIGLGFFFVRRRARRASKEATQRPWFKRQGWVDSSKTNVAEVPKDRPTSMV